MVGLDALVLILLAISVANPRMGPRIQRNGMSNVEIFSESAGQVLDR